ncbi:MAG: SLC13 family permease, partial [Balneolaceae bacterium]
SGLSSPDYSPTHFTTFISTLADPIIILFLGGFVLADASVKYNFDKYLTKKLLTPFGSRPKFIILGLMIVTGLLSAFMSNTATTAMMITVVIPIIARMQPGDPARVSIALSIPFAANIGGMATPIGTPPNAVVIAALNQQGKAITFSEWMIYALPITLVMLFFSWIILLRLFPPKADRVDIDMKGTLMKTGNARLLYVIFAITVLLWITESYHGIKSSIVALLPVAVLTLSNSFEKSDIRKLPWEVLWLIAGGISLGIAMKDTGLASWLVELVSWDQLGALALIGTFGIVTLIMSNFLSNTVTASLLIPIAISMAVSGVFEGMFGMLMVGLVIALSASFAMVLPISTPPNAVAISTGVVETRDMALAGILIGLAGVILVIVCSFVYWPFIL